MAGRRALGITLALLLEGLLLLALLTLGSEEPPPDEEAAMTVLNLAPFEVAEEPPEAGSPEPEERTVEPQPSRPPATEEPLPPQPVELPPAPTAPPIVPMPYELPRSVPTNPARPAPPATALYGPPDRGGSSFRDTERVGTAPNGEALYAAAWYSEPREDELRGYLSTARGPGWGLIACRTAPNYRVEDCVALNEYPQGSQINRAVLAAAWQFKVRPPRLGGRLLVGSWVRIRIDYDIERR